MVHGIGATFYILVLESLFFSKKSLALLGDLETIMLDLRLSPLIEE